MKKVEMDMIADLFSLVFLTIVGLYCYTIKSWLIGVILLGTAFYPIIHFLIKYRQTYEK